MSFDQDPNEQANISGADLAIMVDELKSLKQERNELADSLKNCEVNYGLLLLERDELAAQVEVMRDALNTCFTTCHALPSVGSEQFYNIPLVQQALSLTPSAALREIEARVLEEAADRLFETTSLDIEPAHGCENSIRRMAADKRKGTPS